MEAKVTMDDVGTDMNDEDYFADTDTEPVTNISLEHIFITDLEFIDKEDVEYEDTLREYEESLKTGRSLKVGFNGS